MIPLEPGLRRGSRVTDGAASWAAGSGLRSASGAGAAGCALGEDTARIRATRAGWAAAVPSRIVGGR
ncbi:hypothetical protein A5680_18735 [Mycobacterium sp. E2989]|nr:hypothetical protein A5680_18735 [Mycobacterium sp. E2989]